MSAAARLYWPQQQQTCWHRPPLNGHGIVLVDEDLNTYTDMRILNNVLIENSEHRRPHGSRKHRRKDILIGTAKNISHVCSPQSVHGKTGLDGYR
jgi:hypothetical protein